jgi:hypothetical protein
MVCFRWVIINTLHKGGNRDDDDDDNDSSSFICSLNSLRASYRSSTNLIEYTQLPAD